MPSRRAVQGAKPEALFKPPPEPQALAARMRPRTFEEFVNAQRTILFIDEIHRFNKAQQDALLLHVEDGTVTLIGATTENP
jgi:replication-associated recombination protein RarA